MSGIRQAINKSPWMGWAVAGVLLVASAAIFVLRRGPEDPYDLARLTQDVTIRFTDTNEEVTMPRGRFEKELRVAGGPLDAARGILNKATGQHTGVLVNKREWEETVKRLNAEREEAMKRTPAPAKKKA